MAGYRGHALGEDPLALYYIRSTGLLSVLTAGTSALPLGPALSACERSGVTTSEHPAMMRDLAALRRGRVALRRDGEANHLSFSDRGMLIDDRLLTKLLWPPILPVTGNPRCRSGLFGRLSLRLASRWQRPSNQCERWRSDRD